MHSAILKSIGWFPFLYGYTARPISIQVRLLCFPTCYEFIWSGNMPRNLKCVSFFSPSSSPLTDTHSHRHAIMAFHGNSALANSCVWPTSQSMSRQVAGSALFFSANLNNIKCWRQTASPVEQPAGVSEAQKLYCLLERKERRTGGGRQRRGSERKPGRNLEPGRGSFCVCECVGVRVRLVPKSNPRHNLRP